MKKILVLHTGGTISMQENEKGTVASSEKNPMMQVQVATAPHTEVLVEEFFNLPSPHITVEDMLQLKNRILKSFSEEEVQGVVITHGTDTLEETAFFLDCTIASSFPIVLTGAMRSSNELGSDGLYNYLCALRVAQSEEAKDKGVLVVMNDEIHAAQFVTKTHTTNVATFCSPTHGPIGIVTKKQILFFYRIDRGGAYNVQGVSGMIPIIKAYAGMTGDLIGGLNEKNINGLVIEALGAGNLPPSILGALRNMLVAGIPVVLVSRCFNGVAEPVYAYEGGGVALEKMGVLFCRGINAQKARLKLLVALNANLTEHALQAYMVG